MIPLIAILLVNSTLTRMIVPSKSRLQFNHPLNSRCVLNHEFPAIEGKLTINY